MNLLVVRTGINFEPEQLPTFHNLLQEKLPQFVILVLHGENENIETSFETVNIY